MHACVYLCVCPHKHKCEIQTLFDWLHSVCVGAGVTCLPTLRASLPNSVFSDIIVNSLKSAMAGVFTPQKWANAANILPIPHWLHAWLTRGEANSRSRQHSTNSAFLGRFSNFVSCPGAPV